MRINWLATTALAALVGSGVAFAQTQEPQQRHEQKAGEHQKGAPQAQQEHKQQSTQREERGENKQPSLAQRPEGESKAKGAESQSRAQGNEPAQNAQGENASQGKAAEKRASESRKRDERNARQESNQESKGQKGQAKAGEQKPSGQAQDTTQSKTGQSQNTAQGKQDTKSGKQNQAVTRSSQGTNPATATNNNTSTSTNAAQNNNAATTTNTNTASAKLSESDRTKVFSRLSQDRTTTRENINVQVNVGERLPSRVHPHRLPADIVTIMPEYRGYDYVMVQDEIVIVRPGTRQVVDVIHQGGPTMARRGGSTHITLSSEQRQNLLRETRTMKSAQVSSSGSSCLSMQPVPQSIASQNPDLRGLQLIKIGDEAVLVDPKDQKIVDVIRQ